MTIAYYGNCKCIIQYEDLTPLILNLPKWVKTIRRCRRHSSRGQAHLVEVVGENFTECRKFGKTPTDTQQRTILENLRVLKESS